MRGGRCGGGEHVEDGAINLDVHTGEISECVGPPPPPNPDIEMWDAKSSWIRDSAREVMRLWFLICPDVT
jgi:hypothetical protein